MKETLKDKFNKVKTNVKQTFDQATADDKGQLNKDIKQRNVSGVSGDTKEGYRRDKI